MNKGGKMPCVRYRKECIKDAMATLSHYLSDPFVTDFLKKFKLPVLKTSTATEKRKLIQLSVLKKKSKPGCNDLLEYIDELKMWGKQHIFLFSLQKDEKAYLMELSKSDYIKNRLQALGLGNRFNKNICKYKAKKPFLAEVRHPQDQGGVDRWLTFKWIETRDYEQRIKNRLEIKEERSTNFFRINLENGHAELRIQIIQSNPSKKLDDEYSIYIKEIEKLVDFHHFSPVLLEPIMKKFFFKSILPITKWSIKSRKGNLEGNTANPTFVEKLSLPFRNYFLHELSVYWECKQVAKGKGGLYFFMAGDNNGITFNAITDNSKVDFILDKLRTTDNLKFYKIVKKEWKNRSSINGEKPNTNLDVGVIDVITRRIKKPKIKRVIKGVLQVAGLPGIPAVLNGISNKVIQEIVQKKIEGALGISLNVLNILLCVVLMVVLYGVKRMKKYFLRIPITFVSIVIRFLTGKNSPIIINNKEYNDWEKEKQANLPPFPKADSQES